VEGKVNTLVELVEESVEGEVVGNLKDISRTSRRIGGKESHGKRERNW
jgi:hypothetical protein